MKPLQLAVFAIIAIRPALVAGATESEWGVESKFWETGSVVYGKVVSVEKKDDYSGHAVLRLSILASLSGPLDAAKVAELSADVWYGDFETGTSVSELPEKGCRVIAFVRRSEDGTFHVATSFLTFMPNHAAMFKVDGFDSPEVSKLIKALRDVRKEYEKREAERRKGNRK